MKQQYLVIGLGRFGSSIALTLVSLGQEVLGLDVDGARVEELKTELTHVAQGNATDPELLQAIDIEQFDGAVVAIGDSFEANVLTTLALRETKVPYIIAVAKSWEQVRVLRLIGAHHVVFPSASAGELAAYRLVNRHVVDILRLDDSTSVAAVEVGNWTGKSVHDLESLCGLTALGVFRGGRLYPPGSTEQLAPEDKVLFVGGVGALQRLAQLR